MALCENATFIRNGSFLKKTLEVSGCLFMHNGLTYVHVNNTDSPVQFQAERLVNNSVVRVSE